MGKPFVNIIFPMVHNVNKTTLLHSFPYLDEAFLFTSQPDGFLLALEQALLYPSELRHHLDATGVKATLRT